MNRTGSRVLSVVALALVAVLAAGGPEAAAQGQPNNPISSFFNAIFGSGQRAAPPTRGREVRPSERVPDRRRVDRSRTRRSQPSRTQRSTSSRSSSGQQQHSSVSKNETAMNVVIFGDAFAVGLAQGLEEAFAENPDVRIVSAAAKGDSLVGEGPEAWPLKVKAYLSDPEKKVDAAVVMIGGNDRKPIRQGGEEIANGTEKWRDHYAQRAENVMQIIVARGKPLYWVGLPPVKDGATGEDFGYFNEIFRARSYRTGAEFVDVWNGFVDENNAYAQSGPDMKGEIRELREEEGIGFTKAGNRKLAHFVARELRRDFVRDGEFTAELLEVPERPRPYQPSEDMLATGRGEIFSLNSNPRPGGLLAGGIDSGPTPPEDSAYYKVILQGQPPKPEPGRSDDFSWPRESAGG